MNNRNAYGMMLIITVAWLLILGESYLFIAVIRPLGPPIRSDVPSSALKVLLTAMLGAVWVAVMLALDSSYTRERKTPT